MPLKLIHLDVCGPMQATTLGGNKYFSTFINTMCWVYFVHYKSKLLNKFKKFKTMVELKSRYKIKRLKNGRGGEYTSAEFLIFCKDVGNERQLTVAYSPQQNGVAERKNRTIVEISNAMMHENRLPYKLICPTRVLDDITPFKAFSGRKPEIKYLRVFSSICYCHVPNQLRSKLDESTAKFIFIGYGKCEKGYRVYNVQTNKVAVSKCDIR